MTRVALNWRKIRERYNLIGSECENCKTKYFPKRVICPKCRRAGKMKEYKFSGEGEILTYTTIHVPPNGFELLKPYIIAVIKLKEGPSLTAMLTDCKEEDVSIGKKVKMVFRKITEEGEKGVILYGYKFRVVE